MTENTRAADRSRTAARLASAGRVRRWLPLTIFGVVVLLLGGMLVSLASVAGITVPVLLGVMWVTLIGLVVVVLLNWREARQKRSTGA